MSTTIDLRAPVRAPREPRDVVAPLGRPAKAPSEALPPRAPGKRKRASTSPLPEPKVAGRARPAAPARQRVSFRPGGAGFFTVIALVLSFFGLIYLAQISNVARYGYLLSDLQDRQARLDRENELLAYRLDAERTLDRAGTLAGQDYRMQSFSSAPPVVARGGASAAVSPAATAAAGSGPQARFITVRRPAAPVPAPAPATANPTLLDRLWNGIVGVGEARAEAR